MCYSITRHYIWTEPGLEKLGMRRGNKAQATVLRNKRQNICRARRHLEEQFAGKSLLSGLGCTHCKGTKKRWKSSSRSFGPGTSLCFPSCFQVFYAPKLLSTSIIWEETQKVNFCCFEDSRRFFCCFFFPTWTFCCVVKAMDAFWGCGGWGVWF